METDYDSAVALIGMSGRFPGASSVDELWRNVLDGVKGLREITDEELRESGGEPGHVAGQPGSALLMAVSNERDSFASLVSYKLGLRGPSVSVQTFCSTSLVAVHLA